MLPVIIYGALRPVAWALSTYSKRNF